MLRDVIAVAGALGGLIALYLSAGRFEIEGALAEKSLEHDRKIKELRDLVVQQGRDMAELTGLIVTMRTRGPGEVLDRHL